jgi:hypothetical protein
MQLYKSFVINDRMSESWTNVMDFNQTIELGMSISFSRPSLESSASDWKLTTMSSIYNESSMMKPFNVTPGGTTRFVLRLYTSELEQVMFLLYLWINGLVSLTLNFLVVAIISREPRLHTQENLIIAVDATNNVVLVLSGYFFMVAVLQTNTVRPNYYACQVIGIQVYLIDHAIS